MTRLWRSSASSTTSAARAALRRGLTSSRCMRPRPRCASGAWQGREIPLAGEAWPLIADQRRVPSKGPRPPSCSRRFTTEIEQELTTSARCWSRSRSTTSRSTCWRSALNTTRGALYKTVHDSRQKRWAALATRRPQSIDGTTELDVSPSTPTETPPRLLARLIGPPGPELTCEQCFDVARPLRRARAGGPDADAADPRHARAPGRVLGLCAEDRYSPAGPASQRPAAC